ncbi:MAG TPA: type II toxin-antitoxin system VapC family toxin [bacterium]|nr:type II toxin-antitoxin system VapC family toxin [bacterium]
MILLDTDVVSNLMRTVPSPILVRRLAVIDPEEQFTSSITVSELLYGAYRSARTDLILGRLADRIWPNVTVLSFDRQAAEVHGKARADLERVGTPLPEPDLRIAAIALARSLTLVTGNVRHFTRVPGLRVENWLLD